jgi:hypothetical protein
MTHKIMTRFGHDRCGGKRLPGVSGVGVYATFVQKLSVELEASGTSLVDAMEALQRLAAQVERRS